MERTDGALVLPGFAQAPGRLVEPEPQRTMGRFSFFVAGRPMAKGDHTVQKLPNGMAFLREKNAGQKASWRAQVADIARNARGDRPVAQGAVRVRLEVLRVRPLSHFGSGRNAGVLKATATSLPTSSPDLDKLQRSLGDALNGVAWRDDALISTWIVTRRWAGEEGIRVTIEDDNGAHVVVEELG